MNRTPARWAPFLIAAAAALAGCHRESAVDPLAAAQTAYAKQDYAAAVIRTKTVLQKTPTNGAARLLLGQSLLAAGQPAAAAVELRKALEFNVPALKVTPLLAKAMLEQGDAKLVVQQFGSSTLADAAASADLKTTLAAAYAALGQRDNALEAVQSALKEWPQHEPASLLLARLTAAGGNIDGAIGLIDGLIQKNPKDVAALLLKGDLQRLAKNDGDAALATYRAAETADPGSVAARAVVVTMLLDRHDVDGAKADFAKLKAAHPNHPETRLLEAKLAYLDKDYAKVREICTALLKAYPGDVRVLQLAGAAEYRLNSMTMAETYLAQAVKVAPNLIAPRQLLAQTYLRTGQPKKAVDVLRPIVESRAPDAASLTLTGQAHLQDGDATAAQADFERAAKIDPHSTTARTALALGELSKGNVDGGFADLEATAASDAGIRADMALIAARIRTKDLPGAYKAIDALEKKEPNKPIAAALRGTLQLRSMDTAAATASFQKALTLDPHYFPATAGLAAVDMASGNPQAAQKRFEDLLQSEPRNTRAMAALAELKARSGAPKADVIKVFDNAIKAGPSEVAPRVLLVNYLLSQQDAKSAVTAAQAALAAIPNNPEITDRLGAAQLAAGQYQQAVSTYGQIALARPEAAEPLMHMAEAQIAAKDYDGAQATFDQALKVKPGFMPARRGLAALAVVRKRYPQALALVHDMQHDQPKDPLPYALEAEIQSVSGHADAAPPLLRKALDLGGGSEIAVRYHRALLAAGRKDEAARLAESWLKDHARDASFLYYAGDVALAAKDYAGAEANYRKVLEIQPDNALALNNVAWLMARDGRPGAAALAERANELLPDRAPLMDTWAWALAVEKQLPRAIDLQKKAINKAPENMDLHLTLAKIYLKNGDKDRARAELNQLAKLGDRYGAQGEVAELMKTL